MRPSCSTLSDLSPDVLLVVGSYLLGHDVLRLSQTNVALRNVYSRDEVWATRLTSLPSLYQKRSKKEQYLRARCIEFTSPKVMDEVSRCNQGSAAEIRLTDQTTHLDNWSLTFSFDCWFALRSPSAQEGFHQGGVLLGGQNARHMEPAWPCNHRQFVLIDSRLRLHCSMLPSPRATPVATLTTRKWYHLVLSYNTGVEFVYLNGSLVAQRRGEIDTFAVNYMQVGTGCVCGLGYSPDCSCSAYTHAVALPSPRACGWLGFNGYIEDFRLYQGHELTKDDASLLFHRQSEQQVLDKLSFSLKRDVNVDSPSGNLSLTASSQPEEVEFKAVATQRKPKMAKTMPRKWEGRRRARPAA